MTPALRSLQGRIGAYKLHSTHDPRETTANARAAFLARFEAEVDPDGALPEAERLRRATMARKAYFARLAYHSAVARMKRAPDSSKPDAPGVDRDAIDPPRREAA